MQLGRANRKISFWTGLLIAVIVVRRIWDILPTLRWAALLVGLATWFALRVASRRFWTGALSGGMSATGRARVGELYGHNAAV